MHWLRWRGAVLVFIAASFGPLDVLATNVVGIVRPERVFALMAIVWVAGMLLVWALTALGVDVTPAENTSFVVIVAIMGGGAVFERYPDVVATLLLVLGVVAAGLLFVRFKESALASGVVWAVAVALASGPLLALSGSLSHEAGSSVMRESGWDEVSMTDKPDIFLIVLDGYPGRLSSGQDDLPKGVIDVESELRRREFQVPLSWSSYWATTLSIPSLLNMDYPITSDGWRNLATKTDLQDVISGDSATVRNLVANGYTTHMVESGWSGSSCTDVFVECVPSPLVDEATYMILRKTVAKPLLRDNPGPYVLGALAGFEWLVDHAPEISASDTPDFVFMHVVSPHPPLLLDDECNTQFSLEGVGTGFNIPGVPTEVRERLLVEQIDCVDRMMLELADAVSPSDVVIFVSDHGTERRYQANPDVVDWDDAAILERMNNFLAVRLPTGCTIADGVVVPNVLRDVFACLSSEEVSTVEPRIWVNPMRELDGETVTSLLAASDPGS